MPCKPHFSGSLFLSGCLKTPQGIIMSEIISLTPEIQAIFPYVSDKAMIDFVNGLHVAQELNAVQQSRHTLSTRFLDSLSGNGKMRQDNINDHMIHGLESCLGLFQELSHDMERHGVALLALEHSIQNLENSQIKMVHHVLDLKNAVAEHKNELSDLKYELNANKRLILAEQQMNRLMDKWAAGGLNQLSPIGRCYAVLDALYWGAFGNHLRNDKNTSEFMDNLRDKLIIRLQNDLNISRDKDLIRDEWLRLPENTDAQLQTILAYQGDWSLKQPKDFSTTFTATQWQQLPSPERIEYQNVPFAMMDIERVTKRLIRDRFED